MVLDLDAAAACMCLAAVLRSKMANKKLSKVQQALTVPEHTFTLDKPSMMPLKLSIPSIFEPNMGAISMKFLLRI